MIKNHLSHPIYRPDIDGLRALAILSVVLFHAFPQGLRGGFVGVDVFFVISGFLITGIIQNHLARGDFSFRAFYAARIRRIFPALILVLFFCLVVGWFILLTDEYKQLGKHVAGGAGFISNFLLWREAGYFDNASETKPLLHLWSLGVEEQFYIVWPFLLWGAYKLRCQATASLFFIAGASLAANLLLAHYDSTADFYSPASRFWELMVGAGLAWAATLHAPQNVSVIEGASAQGWRALFLSLRQPVVVNDLKSLVGLCLIVGADIFFTKSVSFPGWHALLPAVGAALLISAGPSALVNRFVLSHRVVVWIGLISYPLYLWHWSLLSFAQIIMAGLPPYSVRLVVVISSVFLAWLTYRLIERPVRFGQHSKAVLVGICVLMVAVGGVGYDIYVRDGLKFREIVKTNTHIHEDASINEQIEHRYVLSPCDMDDSIVAQKIKRFCTQYGDKNAKETIVLWGDSHSGQDLGASSWSPVFYDYARQHGDMRVIRFSHPGCPPPYGG